MYSFLFEIWDARTVIKVDVVARIRSHLIFFPL
jgi:hypothetical protein